MERKLRFELKLPESSLTVLTTEGKHEGDLLLEACAGIKAGGTCRSLR